jgi:hypothetical protein
MIQNINHLQTSKNPSPKHKIKKKKKKIMCKETCIKTHQKLQNKKHRVVWIGCATRMIFVTYDVCAYNNSCKCPHDNTHHMILGGKLKV